MESPGPEVMIEIRLLSTARKLKRPPCAFVFPLSLLMYRVLLFSILTISAPSAVRAQAQSSGLIAPEMVRQLGLERMWFTQLSLDRGRGRVAGVHVHVSSTQAHTVFQIAHAGKRYV